MGDNLKIQISLRGDMTKEYIDLHYLGIALINIQAIFDRSYCFYTGHKKITSNDRQHFKIVAYNVKRGSIIFDAALTLFTLQQSLPTIQTIDSKLIFKATVASFKYLYKLLSQASKNNIPKINIINSPGTIINYNSNSNTISAPKDIVDIAQSSRPIYRRMSPIFNARQGELSICSEKFPEDCITLNNENARLFKSNTVISDIPIILKGVVKSFSAENLTGHFDVLSGNAIPMGKYYFAIKDSSNNATEIFIDSLKGNVIQVIAFVEYDVSPTTQSSITKLHLKPAKLIEPPSLRADRPPIKSA